MTKSKLLHYFLAVGGILAVLAPDLTGLAAALSGLGVGWLNWIAKGLGIAALIGSRWDVIRAKVQPLLGPPSPNTPVVCLLALGSLLIAGCSSAKPKPVEVARVAIMCAQTACDSTPPGPCQRLISSAIACLVSQGNVTVCLAGVPPLVQVGYADVVCVVDALGLAHPEPNIRESAAKWLQTQNVSVIR